MTERNRLTRTKGNRTFARAGGNGGDVDATTKRLLKKLEELEGQRVWAANQIRSIRIALELAGVKPAEYEHMTGGLGRIESEYIIKRPFSEMGLADACARILQDFSKKWLSKAEVEYLLVRGGYEFATSTKNPTNSVDVTLRRMADEGKCDAERVRGSRGNRYRWISPEVKEEPKQER